MAAYQVIIQGGPMEELNALRQRLGNLTALLNRIADQVVLPALARNYDASGLKAHSGILKRGISQRGARGNYIRASGLSVTVGVNYGAIPYAKWALEGRGPVRAKRAKALHFFIGGKEFFRKSVGAAPAHNVYYLAGADLDRIREMAREYMKPKGVSVAA